jgi:hypothetical protein
MLREASMTPLSHSDAVDDLRALLSEDHARLEVSFQRLKSAFAGETPAALSQLWTQFERDLATHFELEERYVLPKFQELAPAEAAVLMREHAEIRTRLSRLGVALDLHLTRADAVDAFICTLQSHAAREDALLYRWAQTQLGGPARSALLSQLRGSLRDLVGLLPRDSKN